jgi:uncharacterized membrane protein YagU involved in acid resistance
MTSSTHMGMEKGIVATKASWRQALRWGVIAGLVAGSGGMIPVWLIQSSRGVGIIPQMQLAASGVIGMAAYDGLGGFFLGIAMHFFVSIVPAIAYAIVAWRLPLVDRLAWISGPLMGLVVFLFMGLVVLPLSAFAMPETMTAMPFVSALLIHMFAFGLPIALVVKRGRLTDAKPTNSLM